MARHTARTLAATTAAVFLSLTFARTGLAHGSITGAQDLVQDNAILLFLLAVVLIGAGVLAWVMLSPQPDPDPDSDD